MSFQLYPQGPWRFCWSWDLCSGFTSLLYHFKRTREDQIRIPPDRNRGAAGTIQQSKVHTNTFKCLRGGSRTWLVPVKEKGSRPGFATVSGSLKLHRNFWHQQKIQELLMLCLLVHAAGACCSTCWVVACILSYSMRESTLIAAPARLLLVRLQVRVVQVSEEDTRGCVLVGLSKERWDSWNGVVVRSLY